MQHNFVPSARLSSPAPMLAVPALAADVTPDRLINAEPHNWLMNHRTYATVPYVFGL